MSKSGVPGVYWTDDKRWRVDVVRQGQHHHGGYFDELSDAVAQRVKMESEMTTRIWPPRPYVVPDVPVAVRDTDWTLQAACRGRFDLFFPEYGPRPHTEADLRKKVKLALDICDTCPVVAECLARARAFHVEDGIWGGRFFGIKQVRSRAYKEEYRREAATLWG